MDNATDRSGCAARAWRLAAISGAVIAVLGIVFGGWGVVASVLVGIVVAGALGLILVRVKCAQAAVAATAPAVAPEPTVPEPAPTLETETELAPAPEPEAPARPDVAKVKPSASLPGQLELAARKGTWRYQAAAETD